MLCGLPATGKTEFMKNYIPKPNHTYTLWNRENIMNMISNDNYRIEKFNKAIETLETEIIREMFTIDFHQVVTDGWYLKPYARKKILSFMAGGDSLCLVFDAELQDIIKRAEELKKIKLPQAEIQRFVKDKYDSTIWPSFEEGWTDIIYMCSFDTENSKKYFERTLTKVK